MANINGTPGADTLNGVLGENDNVFGLEGNDTINIGENNPALFDFASGDEGDDTITITGLGEGQGGAGNDRIVADPIPGFTDNSAFATYLDAPAGISANLTASANFGLAGGDTTNGFRVADGFGTTDLVFGINFFQASNNDDQIRVDSSYLTDFGNWIEVRPNGGDDTVVFDAVGTARISYFRSGGGVRADMQAGTATDRNDADSFIGDDTFTGANEFRGSNHDDHIFGANGDDRRLRGAGGNDEIDGRAGNDRLEGEDGNDLLTGGAGNDTIDGGAGNDAWYGPQPGPVVVNLLTGTASDGFGGTDTLISIESGHSSFFDDSITMSNSGGYWFARAGDDTVTGGSGGEIHLPGSGNDTVDAGAGEDTVSYHDDSLIWGADVDGSGFITQGATIDLAAGTAIDGWGDTDSILNFENAEGTQLSDTITGTGGSNRLVGFEGDDSIDGGVAASPTVFDFLEGGDGNDTITVRGLGTAFGGQGNDRIVGVTVSTGPTDERDFVEAVYFDSAAGIVANLSASEQGGLAGGDNSAGFRVSDGLGGVDLVSNIHVVGDTGFNDQFFVDSTFQNGFGSWVEIKLSGGDDTVTLDGVSVASVSYAAAQGAVRVDLGAGTGTDRDPLADFIGEDTFIGANRARGSNFDDELLGSAGADQLRGRGGNDFLSGGAGDDLLYGDERATQPFGGNDTLAGGAGADQLVGGAGDDSADYSSSASAVTVDIKAGAASGGDAEGDTFTSIEGVIGSALADTLTAGATVNNWHMLQGGDGDDTLTIVGLGVAVGNDGDDRIVGVSSGDLENGDFVEVAFWDAAAGIVANLSASAQGGLAGGTNEDGFLIADGLGGTDSVSAIHVLSDTGFDDAFFVDSSFQNSFGNWIEINLSGGDDTVTLNSVAVAGVNYGRAGGAVLVDLAAGTATDRNGADDFIGNDSFAGANRARGTSFDDDLRGSSGNDQLRGRQGNDLLTGGDGDDILYGDERASTPWGGNDLLTGGQGSDTMFGGLGSDIAVFEGASTDYTYQVFGAGLRVTEIAAGANGIIDTDQLASVETLRFSDGDFAASGFVTTVIPTEGDDVIEVDDSGGTIDAGEGNDEVIGGGGDDFIAGGAGDDDLSGGAGVDTLLGGDGNETIDGGEGADIMLGGDGDDTYEVNDTFDLVDEGYVFPDAGFGGNDTINSSADWFWDVYGIAEVLRIAEGIAGPEGVGSTVVGGVFDNEIIGNDQTNVLFGRGGSDIYRAGDGIDFMSLSLLGVPEDLYDGVNGVNTIVVEERATGPNSYDIVFEFESGRDKVDVSDYGYADAAAAFATGVDDGAGNSYFALGDGFDYVYMVGLELSELSAADFIV